ncbi:DUF4974 domain-containing protein [bacterium]|nr:DUF4974 domain-containing protein [bacterium]
MMMKCLGVYLAFAMILAVGAGAFAANEIKTEAKDSAAEAAATSDEVKISIDAKDMDAADVFKTLAEKSKQKIVVESSVKNNMTFLLSELPLQTILETICKTEKLDWRKVYIDPKSKLLEQPDRLAATIRLASGLSFPDIVIAGSSSKKCMLHSENDAGVQAALDTVVNKEGLQLVYVITNDAAVAAKKAEDNKAVNKFKDSAKEQMDLFMSMSPEEREQAIIANLDMMNNIGPEYMSAVMQTMLNANPDSIKLMVSRQTDMLFNMPQEQRRAMLKLNMQTMSMITAEQREILQEDAKAVAEEMKEESQD